MARKAAKELLKKKLKEKLYNKERRLEADSGYISPKSYAKDSKEILVVECKPKYDKDDEEKLNQVLIKKKRQQLFVEELLQRRLINESEKNLKIKFCLANNSKIAPLQTINNIFISDNSKECLVIRPTNADLGIS